MLGLPSGSWRDLSVPTIAAPPGNKVGAEPQTLAQSEASDWPRALEGSYAWCVELTRRSRSNFYYSFLTLPRSLFRDMCGLYALMRVSDDLGDDDRVAVDIRTAFLDHWRSQVQQALDGGPFEHPLLPALADVVARHQIPREHLLAVIDGVRMDLDPRVFETFDQLANYCYHVAGAVGLCCIQIWGFTHAQAPALAVDCGLAFQLTNILRDVAEDARVGRCYLPREDLRRFGLTIDELRTGTGDSRFRDLMSWEAERARHYFDSARRLVPLCKPAGRPILDVMIRTYSALLDAIESRGYEVHKKRIALSRGRKLIITLGSYLRYRWSALGRERSAEVADRIRS